jgi:hypothetical protein
MARISTASKLCMETLEKIITARGTTFYIDDFLIELKKKLEELDYATFTEDDNMIHSALIDEFPDDPDRRRGHDYFK